MPETKELVINTTPILALIAAAGSLDMLPLLYLRVWVSCEVCREIQAGGVDGFASRSSNGRVGCISKPSLSLFHRCCETLLIKVKPP